MKFQIKSYEIPFRVPFITSQGLLKQREGILIYLEDDKGNFAYGEIAPFPHYHQETLEQAFQQVKEWVPLYLKHVQLDSFDLLSLQLIHLYQHYPLYPSVKLGLEMALFKLFFKQNKTNFFEHFEIKNKPLPVNGMLQISQSFSTKQIDSLVSKGYRTLKLKIGKSNPEKTLELVKSVREMLLPDMKLRLDVNRNWSYDLAEKFFLELGPDRIEYVEEPLLQEQSELLPKLIEKTKIPVALDETLFDHPEWMKEDLSLYQTIIFKPGFHGGFFDYQNLLSEAKVPIVLTSAFQSQLTLSFLYQLACLNEKQEYAIGLDTGSYFSQSILLEGFNIKQGSIYEEKSFDSDQFIRQELLKPIEIAPPHFSSK